MPSIYDVYLYYLEPKDLKDKAHVVIVQSAKREDMPNPRTHVKETKIVVRFEKARKAMILNKTQAGAMAEVAGTDDYTKWGGTEVVLVADVASNGKNTIRVTDRANSGDIDLMYPKPTPAPATPPAPDLNTVATTSVRPVNVPLEFWETRSDTAVKYAAEQWHMNEAIVWAKMNTAVESERLSAWLPEAEFKAYVALPQ